MIRIFQVWEHLNQVMKSTQWENVQDIMVSESAIQKLVNAVWNQLILKSDQTSSSNFQLIGNTEEHNHHHNSGTFSKKQDHWKFYRQVTQFLLQIICKGRKLEMEEYGWWGLRDITSNHNVQTYLDPDSIKLWNIHIIKQLKIWIPTRYLMILKNTAHFFRCDNGVGDFCLCICWEATIPKYDTGPRSLSSACPPRSGPYHTCAVQPPLRLPGELFPLAHLRHVSYQLHL